MADQSAQTPLDIPQPISYAQILSNQKTLGRSRFQIPNTRATFTPKTLTTHLGLPGLHFDDAKCERLEEPLRLTLVGKFSRSRPQLERLRRDFQTAGFKGQTEIYLIDNCQVLIHFDLADDFYRCWLHKIWNFGPYSIRITKWSPEFNPNADLPIAPMIKNPVCGPQGLSPYGVNEEDVQAATNSNGDNFLYNLSVLKEKVQQAESLATMFIGKCSDQFTDEVIASNMGTLIQEIIVSASSLMFTCQYISLGLQVTPSPLTNNHHHHDRPVLHHENGGNHPPVDWYGDGYMNSNEDGRGDLSAREVESSKNNGEIVEMDAADLLAKYTHYCQVCGKGFKRDANLRMHMRAHGDEYKSRAALSNPIKKSGDDHILGEKYSCPQEGCRYNKKHPRFQPLKSMICVKNHYKRCHCPKMYVCNLCNRKRFSVLSDLRTHEKHCGDLKWMCSCGNSFSRKDKLLGHVALFIGHSPAPTSLVKMGKVYYDQTPGQMQSDESLHFT